MGRMDDNIMVSLLGVIGEAIQQHIPRSEPFDLEINVIVTDFPINGEVHIHLANLLLDDLVALILVFGFLIEVQPAQESPNHSEGRTHVQLIAQLVLVHVV